MLASSTLPEKYRQWNTQHGAPAGSPVRFYRLQNALLSHEQFQRLRGPYAVQCNSSTRAFEYPWAFEVAAVRPAMQVLEIGGGLAGFQFTLAQSGCRVVNVDPGMKTADFDWPCDEKSMTKLNHRFHTQVQLRNTTVEKAGFAEAEFDLAYSISVVEHLSPAAAASVMAQVYRCLKPGGRFILTIDLFLNLHPFTSRTSNDYGINQNIRELIAVQPWELIVGNRAELFGFAEFDRDAILSRLETFMVSQTYPVLTQCLVLQKPANS